MIKGVGTDQSYQGTSSSSGRVKLPTEVKRRSRVWVRDLAWLRDVYRLRGQSMDLGLSLRFNQPAYLLFELNRLQDARTRRPAGRQHRRNLRNDQCNSQSSYDRLNWHHEIHFVS